MLRAMGDQIDVVHVCTPSGDHMEPALMALNAKKNVICEKPMEIQLDRIDRMIATAKENSVRLAGIFQNRWNQANRQLKRAARRRTIRHDLVCRLLHALVSQRRILSRRRLARHVASSTAAGRS